MKFKKESLASLDEGGAVGHLQHLYDNPNLTFGEIKEIFNNSAEGKLEKVSEKLDGMNLVFSYDASSGQLRAARNGSDIKTGGMDGGALAKKFFGRGNVEDAFNGAFEVLNQSLGALSDNAKQKVFGDNANRWYSMEIIYTQNPGTINYDGNSIVFHGWPVFEVAEDGSVGKASDDAGINLLSSKIEQMQKAVKVRDWQVKGPSLVTMKKMSDGTIVQKAISDLDQVMSSAGVGDGDSLLEYLRSLTSNIVAGLDFPDDVSEMIVERTIEAPGAPGIPDIKRACPRELHDELSSFFKESDALKRSLMAPVEEVIRRFAIEVLRGVHSTLIANSDAEVQRLQSQVSKAISAIERSGHEGAMAVLKKEMERLGNTDSISAAMEGIVFFYKGQAYKYTGSFAATHQILSLFKYERKGVPKMSFESVSRRDKGTIVNSMDSLRTKRLLREAIRMMLSEAGSESRAGEALEAEELAAKEAYEKAKADLARWDAENAKKTALADKAKELGITLGDNKASKNLRTQPQFNYDVKVLQAKRDTLEKRLEKLQNEYGAYEPSAVEYRRVASGGAKTSDDMQRPDGSEKVYFPIKQVKPLTWYQWNDSRWSRAVSKIAFGSSKEKSGLEQAGTGPGEERLTKIFGGRTQGGSVSFDVVTPDDRRWEVKALESASATIRPGTEGKAAFDRPKKQLDAILKQIKNFSIVTKKFGAEVLAVDDDDIKVMRYVDSFVDEELVMFAKGEISPERFKALRAVLKSLSTLKTKWSAGRPQDAKTTVGLGEKDIDVDKSTYIDVAKRVQKSKPDVDVLSSFEERELATAVLKDIAFEKPSEFFNDWFDSIDVNKVFEQVDGVFIVNSSGFNMVPKPLFKKAFKFHNVSQATPKFKFVYYNGAE
jgi:hypothetical protein